MEYRCVATSITGFVQQLVSCYLPHGYWFYVVGIVPDGKSLESIDRKLIAKYGIGISRSSRARRKAMGIANVHYLRHEGYFVLLATHGQLPQPAQRGGRRVLGVRPPDSSHLADGHDADPMGECVQDVSITRTEPETFAHPEGLSR